MNDEERTIKNIVFFGDSIYSKIVLNKLNKSKYKPQIVIGKNTDYSILNAKYFLGIIASFGKIIPENIIKKFKYGILNIHPSLLPKYRGPSPLQQTIVNNDKITGVTIIKLTEKVDTGPIVAQKEFVIDKKYTSRELGEILFNIGADLLIDILKKSNPLINMGFLTIEQDENKATYTRLIKKQDARINWKESPEIIERKIRAYREWPIIFTFAKIKTKKHDTKILKIQILKACIENKELQIEQVRPEGKRDMNWSDFLRGYSFQGFLD
ncbi:MAG: methionyl-tRNA formyltransferase [Parcubacteria group bacterium GW2011_GWA2_31_28]|nr:MAG: methionyl-tRNA formyltransferase [Parcubacteria group bacterium GW2011_GWA2_31_28]